MEVLHELLDSLEQIIDLADPGLISLAQATEAFGLLSLQLVQLDAKKAERTQTQQEGDFDEEDAEVLADEIEMDGDVMNEVRLVSSTPYDQ